MTLIQNPTVIDRDKNFIIQGRYEWQRDSTLQEGILVPPQGTSFPSSPDTGEIFWRTDLETLYRYDGSAWQSEGIAGELSGVTVSDSTGGAVPTSYADITWDTTDFENNTNVLEHDNTNTDRILIKETGTYAIAYSLSIDSNATEAQMDFRVRKNDTDILAGSIRTISEDDEINDVSNFFLVSLTANDFISLQCQSSATGDVRHPNGNFTVLRVRAPKGAKGDQGEPGNDGGANISNVIWVAKNGNDTTGDGSFHNPYLTVGQANTSITDSSSTNPYIINIAPGMYTEAPITIKDYVSIRSVGGDFSVYIIASNASSPLLTTGNSCLIESLVLSGTTSSSLISSSQAFSIVTLRNVSFYNAQIGVDISAGTVVADQLATVPVPFTSVGTVFNVTTGYLLAHSFNSALGSTATTIFYANGSNATIQINATGLQGTATNGLYANNGGTIAFSTYACINCTNAIRANNTSIISGVVPYFDNTITKHIYVEDLSSVVQVQGGQLNTDRLDYPAGYQGDILFMNSLGKDLLVFHSKVSIGRANKGRDLDIGRGDPYTDEMVVYTTDSTATSTTDGGNITDVTTAAASSSGSTFSFQGVAANHTILFSTEKSDTTDTLQTEALRFSQTTAAVEITKRSFALEYWNGSAWTELTVMTTEKDNLYRYANEIFIRANSQEDVFFPLPSDWAKKTINTKNLYWLRFRITDALTTAPVFEQFQIGTSRCRFSSNGLQALYGRARYRQVVSSAGNTFGESGGVTNTTTPVGSGGIPTGWDHAIKNSTMNGAGDAIYIQASIPRGLCTSCPIKVEVNYTVRTSGASTDGSLIISVLPVEVTGVMEADPAGGSVPVARTLANTETLTAKQAQTSTRSIQLDTDNKIICIESDDIDISNYYEGDMIVIRIEYDDTGSGDKDITIFTIAMSGVIWTPGERI